MKLRSAVTIFHSHPDSQKPSANILKPTEEDKKETKTCYRELRAFWLVLLYYVESVMVTETTTKYSVFPLISMVLLWCSWLVKRNNLMKFSLTGDLRSLTERFLSQMILTGQEEINCLDIMQLFHFKYPANRANPVFPVPLSISEAVC